MTKETSDELLARIEALEEIAATGRDYVFDVACGGGWRFGDPALIAQARADLERFDATLRARAEQEKVR